MIGIKTADLYEASSDADTELEICDANDLCCKTAGRLDNPGAGDRERGKLAIYKDSALLGACFEVNFICPIICRSFSGWWVKLQTETTVEGGNKFM